MLIIVAAAGAIFLARPDPARAAQVRLPLTIDYIALREALKRNLFTAPGGRAQLWNGIDDCQFLYAENPEFSRATAGGPATVKLETANSLGLGVSMGSQCLNAVQWSGIVEALGVPYIAPGLQLKFHFTDLNLYDSAHQKTELVSRGFDLIKSYLIPQLDGFSYDLKPAVAQLGAMVADSVTPEAADRVRAAIASLSAEPDIVALDDGIRVTLVMTVPDVPTPAAIPGAAASPTPAELKAFQNTLDQWDAFLVFSIKQLGDAVGDQQFRDQLLQILLDSRYRLVQALNNSPAAAGPDPVRILFLDEWRQLHDAVRAAARRGMLGARALEFMSFISAGDALFALDQAAPALGMRISAADLRRLAHIMAPGATGDPLQFNYREDPDLKKLFAVPEPPASRHPIEEEDVPPSAPGALPSSGGASTPAPDGAPPGSSAPPASPGPGASRRASRQIARLAPLLLRMLSLLSPREAAAAQQDKDDEPAILPQLRQVAGRLYRRVVTEDNAQTYRRDMGLLLDLSAERQLGESAIDAGGSPIYATLVRSTAWQESCWRQFVIAGAGIRWLESATGDIGLMQVNKHVWRGFYAIDRLKWDVLYNAGAGCEILARMMRYASARLKFDPVPVAGHLARSAYAAYNGGPGACNRWRRREPPALKQIDSSFWDKYRAVQDGTPIDILSCARTWGHHSAN
ncbi:transglycosylase SLT domain-containing protein [Candidatus Binatus sp.]|uniref:lytic transglycosylase domain-containing protein n=1 Tax=Candidatus Binatus sp. TaxID=2811406 RepID=UPI002F943035